MKALNIEVIKAAIKAQKWDKHSYYYAYSAMLPYYPGSVDCFLKKELIEKFYRLIETKFSRIEHFTTFKDFDCYLPEQTENN